MKLAWSDYPPPDDFRPPSSCRPQYFDVINTGGRSNPPCSIHDGPCCRAGTNALYSRVFEQILREVEVRGALGRAVLTNALYVAPISGPPARHSTHLLALLYHSQMD